MAWIIGRAAGAGTIWHARSRGGLLCHSGLLNHLNQSMQDFIARMEMVFVASADAEGTCDCSFRAGAPGFVQVLDDKTMAYPEYRGNGVLATVGNILDNPHIGLIFLDFYQTTVGA